MQSVKDFEAEKDNNSSFVVNVLDNGFFAFTL